MDKIILKKEYFENIQLLDETMRCKVVYWIISHFLLWEEIELTDTWKFVFDVIKKYIDKDIEIRELKGQWGKKHTWNQYTKAKSVEPTKKEDVKTKPVVQDNSSTKKEWLKKYWQYVELTDEEYKKLIYMFGSCTWYTYQWEAHLKLNSKPIDDKIEDMNNYIINWKWKPYTNYYLALRNRFKREWKPPYWERWSAEEMKAYLEKENSWQLYYRAYVEFREKIEFIKDTLWKVNIEKNQDFYEEYEWHFFLDYN